MTEPEDAAKPDIDEVVDPALANNPTQRVMAVWEDVVADMEATAEEYREDGYEVVELHPGDVAPVESGENDRWGFDVLTPDDEIPEIERLVVEEGHDFDSCEVFKAQEETLVLLVAAITAEDPQKAVLVPLYYDVQAAGNMFDRAREEGELPIHVRNLKKDTIITFTQDVPSLFAPDLPE